MINLLIITFIVFVSCSVHFKAKAQSEQNYIVFIDDSLFKVKTDITDEVVFYSDDASTAIQLAIDNVGNSGINGGEVLLREGLYRLNNCLVLKDNIWLHGSGESTVLQAEGQLEGAIIIQDVSMAVVSDFSLVSRNNQLSGASGIIIERSVNCQVLDVIVSDFPSGIVNTEESAMTLINGNQLNNNRVGINIRDGGGIIGKWMPLLVSHNTLQGGNTGISCGAMVVNILNNKIDNVSGRGIVASSNSILLRGNKLSDIGGDYVIYGNGAEFNCTGNFKTDVKGNGIRTRSRWGIVAGNTIKNCGIEAGGKIGIHVESVDEPGKGESQWPAESKVIYDNTIFNDEKHPSLKYGIKEKGIDNVVYGNSIKNANQAIFSDGINTIVKQN